MIVCFKADGTRNWLRMINIRKCLKSNSGQSFVEFVFILPVLFLIFFVFVQFANILDGCQKSRMAFWCGLRASTIPSQTYVGVSYLQPQYKTSDIINWIHSDVFSQNDIVDISIDRGSTPIILNTVNMNVNTYVPYLYQYTILWTGLQNVFKGQTVIRGGKQYFLIKYSGKAWCFTPILPPV